jgi:hypothetical protein
VGIYHGMYVLRMAEALETDYPGLAHFVGENRWHTLVSAYVTAHPSRSYTLNRLGRRLPEWLRRRARLPFRDFCYDLARLEWAVAEAFDAEDVEPLASAEIQALAPHEWPTAVLAPSPALRLLRLGSNAAAWLDSAKDESHRHPRPRRGSAHVVVFRREHAVYRRETSRAAFALLGDLAAGRTVGDAVARALRRRGAPDADVLARWFEQWAADGLFASVARRGLRRAGAAAERSRRSPSHRNETRVGPPEWRGTSARPIG